MLRIYAVGLALAASLGISTIASAEQPLDDRFYVAPLFSYGFFREDNSAPDDQLGGQLSIGKTLTEHLALELYAFHFNDVETDNFGPQSDLDTTGYGISALLFPARDIFPIFGIVGIGEGEHDFDNRTAGPAGLDKQDSDFVDVGVGYIAPIADLGFDLRAEWRYRRSDVDVPGGGEFRFRDHVVSLGLHIPLGEKPQAAPPPPPPKPAPKPAPKPQPVDSDGDGVPDNRDQCPGTPPGTQVSANGCPVAKSAPVVLKGVTFEFNSAKLTSEAGRRLDNVVNALRSSRNINVRVEGHTDSIGSASYNLDLSQRRADSVKNYLTSHGIAPNRLITRGFGETRPVAPNTKPNGADNPAGRAQNRRVELHVVK